MTIRKEFKNTNGTQIKIYNFDGYFKVVKVVERCEMLIEMSARNFYTNFSYVEALTEANIYAETL